MAADKILLTVCARGGSKGVKNKNIRLLCDEPLIAHTLKQAKSWGKADKIICSTDSADIAQIAQQYGAAVPFIRPDQLATDTMGKLAVLQHALKTVEEKDKMQYTTVVDLDVTSPIRQVSDIEGAYQLFLQHQADSVVSATKARRNPYFNMLELQADGFVKLVKMPSVPFLRRQDAPVIYDMNASIYVYKREFILNPATKTCLSEKTLAWEMGEWSAFDIDSEVDFQLIELLVSKGVVKL
ncbi:MAG: acylneuraminate cytidylyltransferase family protein [Candidatus Omnitrophica bacterium]|nr:acylneuraminate cytidylyltransferase family protein [Candidatus Omnitrophota bacterium]